MDADAHSAKEDGERKHADGGAGAEGRRGPATSGAERLPVRVISDRIRLSETGAEAEPARYACCPKGLALLRDAALIPSGGYVEAMADTPEQRDAKTGALFVSRAYRLGQRTKNTIV